MTGVGRCMGLAGPFVLLASVACSPGEAPGEPVELTIPAGASFVAVTDTLVARDLVRFPAIFRLFARLRGDDREIRAGGYRVAPGTRWVPLLDQLVAGRVITRPLTIPEGFTLDQIAGRLAEWTGTTPDEVAIRLSDEALAERWNVPGPGLEGYLFPDTYRFAPGVSLNAILRAMVDRYHSIWTGPWRARADSLGLSEREVTTLASIVQAEAMHEEEMPTISGVYHNRLRIGYLLQADPTVQYALGARRSRLLYADIDSVADHPYNTYTQPGLPPGPIGAPGEAALTAALYPADVDYLYFVARPDGTHIFTRDLGDHNQARVQARREWDAVERSPGGGS
ncbi:MAG: endolytic transglycosylase MltG [Gemmatimonadetes bacterium]|nr:endolytic transglycosylase MltG [Gemmatimonadota bacterium]